ncbi:MAG TPA: sugar phosphate nucleotidyltransferase [Blastocatellia bacterium]|nr:sugar phosphate nucleotidyltransferase [Blastocatellia bacterium]HMV82813.1 sugar phosphate nucleotidyltransferase [Blastocatellia bacterium]HMX27940.1 sugar phosphate nucleotidyltransferase [Blastocatellia bacterium]HMY74179.1 sugar phosphate nucleotidyltransferase [Blastocatellia bacterium]HMZ20461.1 sugar phosphate nucleotidyltransferase [Blastocatellia bacterium]
MKVETGVIAAAGSGTRMLPVTLGYPKELMPIINKPAIQLIIEEFIAAGLKKIVIVTGENPAPLHRQYQPEHLPPRGKYKPLDEFLDTLSGVEIIFEPQAGPYGNGTPLLVARPHIPEGEGFIYAYGDDILKTKVPFAKQLVDLHNETGALVVGTQPVAWEDVVRYGIVEFKDGSDREMKDVIEKPARDEAKSNLAMFGRFLLSTDVIKILSEIPLGKSNELWLTDSVREYIRRGGRVVAQAVTDGEWLTIGDPVNYLQTMIEYALGDAEIRAALEPRIRRIL